MEGLDWIASNAAVVVPAIRVANMSLGRPGTLDDNPALRASVRALYDLGITVVAAAGNDATLEVSQQVPATYPEVLAIASTTAADGQSSCAAHPAPVPRDTASYFTTDGAYVPLTGIGVTVSAPGEDKEDISRRCTLSATSILSTRLGGGTVRYLGTSMAAPHVAGVAALLVEQGGATAPEDVRRRVRLGADAAGAAPLDSPSGTYTSDGVREGVLFAPGALATP
jgi:subtilisin family serine protease